MDTAEFVALNTRLLREDAEPFWVRLRECLRSQNVDPAAAVLATCFPDDGDFEFGTVVTGEGEVFEFGFDYLRKPVAQGVLSEWVRTTDRWQDRPFHDEVRTSLAQLDSPEV